MIDWQELRIISTNYLVKDYATVLKISYHKIHRYQTLEATKNYLNIPLGNFLPSASSAVTTAIDHHTEHTLSPGTCAPAKCSSQPGIQYSGVHPTASSALFHVRTLLFGLPLDHLKTNYEVQFLFITNKKISNHYQQIMTVIYLTNKEA